MSANQVPIMTESGIVYVEDDPPINTPEGISAQKMWKERAAAIAQEKQRIRNAQEAFDGDDLATMHQDRERPEDYEEGLGYDDYARLAREEQEQAAIRAKQEYEAAQAEAARQQQELDQERDDREFDWQQQELDKRINRVNRMALTAMVAKRVLPSPELQQLVMEKLGENVHVFSYDLIDQAISELIEEGRVTPDFSDGFNQKIHQEFEVYRANGIRLPAHYETPVDTWSETLTKSEFNNGPLQEVPASEIKGLTRLVNRGLEKRKQPEKSTTAAVPKTQLARRIASRERWGG